MENHIESILLNDSEFDLGEVEYSVGKATIRFNPTDPLMIGRLYNAAQSLNTRQDEYKQRVAAIGEDSPALLEILDEVNEQMLETLSGIFLHGVSGLLFDGVGAYAYNRSGIPIWVAFISAVMDRMDVSVKSAQSEQATKVERLLAKYKKK